MQNRYTGDIGDFGKYGLLRTLTGGDDEGLSLAVVWYLTPDESHNRDGRHTGYLELDERKGRQFTRCDEELYRALGGIVREGERHVTAVEGSGLLPPETAYHGEILDLRTQTSGRGARGRAVRESAREEWNGEALRATEGRDIVFLDPDNGLETGRVDRAAPGSQKYAYYDELRPYLGRGQSLVVYHHLNRGSRSQNQIFSRQREILERLGQRALAMRYHRGSPRAFIVIPQPEHRGGIMDRIREMTQGPWARHFTMVG